MNIARHEALDRIKRAGHSHPAVVGQMYNDLDYPTLAGDRRLTVLAIFQAMAERPKLTAEVWLPLLQDVAAGCDFRYLERQLPPSEIPRWFRAWCRMVEFHAWHSALESEFDRWPHGHRSDTEEESQ